MCRCGRVAEDVVVHLHSGLDGDGGEHCHFWFQARPARLQQLQSGFVQIWDDVLPPPPEDLWRANLEIVKRELEAS